MPFCEFCGMEIGYLPFKCKYCGRTFCKKHRLPENHECSFEIKHTPIVPTSPKEQRALYQDSKVKVPTDQNYERRFQKERKKYMKQQERKSKQAMRQFQMGMGAPGEAKGTNFLVIMIVLFSITATILAILGLEVLIALSVYGILHLFLWVLFTSLFVSFSYDLFGLLFLLILVIFVYNIAKNIEMSFGTKFLIQLYLCCAAFTAIFYFIIRILLGIIYPFDSYIIPVGLATGAILGLIAFMVYFNPDREMMLCCFFIPVKMKGKTLLIALILFRLIPGLLFGFIISYAYFAYYFPDIGGILASYLVYIIKFKKKYRK